MSELQTMAKGPASRALLLVAVLAAAGVIASLVGALAFAQSASRTPSSASAGSPASPPAPQPAPPVAAPAAGVPAAGAGVSEGEGAVAEDDSTADTEDRASETPGVSITQCAVKDFTVAAQHTVEGDRYFVGNNADVEGTIDGDFFTFGKGTSVPGRVTGDINSLASNVAITGTAEDDVRVLCGDLTVRGKVVGDLMALCGEVAVAKGARIGGRTMVFAGHTTLDGEFAQAMNVVGGEVNFGGHALGDVKVESDQLAFTEGARIDGNLTYSSRQELDSLQGEQAKRIVAGKITYVPKKGAEKKSGAGLYAWVWAFWTFAASFVVGCCLILVARRVVQTILVTARADTLKSFGFGILGHILVPFVGLVLLCACLLLGLLTYLTSGGRIPPLPLAFVPAGLLILAIWAALFYLAKFVVAAALGDTILRRLGRDPSPYTALFVGMIPVWILLSVPVLGSFLHFIIVPMFGIGAILVGLRAHFVKRSDVAPVLPVPAAS